MKIFSHLLFYFLLFVSLFSCGKVDDKIDAFSNKEILNKSRYQIEVFQAKSSEYTAICLNRLTGRVFIAKNGVGWYEALNTSNLLKYKTPTYSVSMITYNDSIPQILLSNNKTAQMYMYVVGHTASFYDIKSTINTLEKEIH